MYDVTAIGELLIDFTSTGTDANGAVCYARHPGGAPANVLAAHQMLGGHTAFIGKVGADVFGEYLAQTLTDIGIATDGLIRSQTENTTLAFVDIDDKGDRSFTFFRNPGADTMLTSDEVNDSLIAGSHMLHFGAFSLSREPARSATLHAVQTAKKAGKIISFDPNDRPLLWKNADQSLAAMREYAAFADIIKVSEAEMQKMTGQTDLMKGAAQLAELGPILVLISMGPGGACYYRDGICDVVPTFDVKTIDTNGAGDAFLGAMLFGLKDMNRDDISQLCKAEIEKMVTCANACGALTTTKSGAISAMPTWPEVQACIRTVPLLM